MDGWMFILEGCLFARRRLPGFFDFRNFSALQGFADRYRTLAERDPKAEGMAWHARLLERCRRKGNPTSMRTVRVVGLSASFVYRLSEARSQRPAKLLWAKIL
jgi:hypothetical protein